MNTKPAGEHDQSRRVSARIRRASRRLLRDLRYGAKRLAQRPVHIHIENRWRIGDEILAIPFYELLHRQFPSARISVGVNHPELLADQSHVTIETDRTEFDCDRYIFLSEDHPGAGSRTESLCLRHGVPFTHLEPRLRIPAMDPSIPSGQPRFAYSIGAGWVCKQWPTEHMRDLLTRLRTAYPRAAFIELGKDCDPVGIGEDMRDKLTLMESALALHGCDLYIGPDSGLVHLALAVGTPAVGLYGPVKPVAAFGPREGLVAVLSPEPCQGCWTDRRMREPGKCALGIDGNSPQDYPCMTTITPETVFEQIEAAGLLKATTA
ncbi:MAG: glycosyltransferase family 9 protein [Verrucomicrobia bacterium]|nr:glycosyltransferase family 9 protein [Verrucomicrobiota bacterium]MDA1085412.1 glycosyltransferase family 9 protein [Verrucomicrobiota bacterium]